MQLAGNTALAAALATGQKRQFAVKLMFDWDRNGNYANANSDLSALFVSALVDRELSGSFPDQLEITEGYVAAQLDLVLEGNLADGTPVWKAFSPYSGYALGSVATIGTPMYLELIVFTSAGPVNIRQFTGYLANPVPSRAGGQVTITCYDAGTSVLANPVTLPTWAVDSYTRSQFPSHSDTPDSGTVALSWVVEEVLRRNGLYIGPPWHPNAICAWTMNGSALPSVGSIALEERFINGTWSFGYGEWLVPQFSPAGVPSTVYGAGQYGSTCFLGSSALSAMSGTRYVQYLYGNAHSNNGPVTGGNVVFNPATMGSNNSNLLGMGAWVKIDPAQGTNPSTILCHLEEAHYNYSSASTTDRYPAYLRISVRHDTGACSAVIWNQGWSTSWTFNATVNLTAGWHYVDFVAAFLPSAINGSWYLDGTLNTTSGGGTAAGIGTLNYNNDAGVTNLCQVVAYGPMQYAQIYYQPNTAIHVAPQRTPTAVTAKVDQSLTRLTWLPDVVGAASWDTLKAAVGAELGALYVTEQGVVTFDSRATVAARQLAANSVLTLTLDQLYDIAPQSSLASIVNTMPYTTHGQQADPYSTIYKASNPTDYLIPPATVLYYPIQVSGVQSVHMGYVSWHPEAQGYNNPSNPTEQGGGGPGTGFTYRDWMNIYGPDYWYDGFTAYAPGSSDPSAQPVWGSGLNCAVQVGQNVSDLDSRHILLTMVNGPSGNPSLEFAVNDSVAFLHVGGTQLQDLGQVTNSYYDPTSVALYGQRSLPFPASDWVQDPTTIATVVQSVINYTRNPHGYLQSVDIVGDPRLQLQDVVTLSDPTGMGASIPASVYGIKRKISVKDGVADTLTLRTF